MQTYEWRRSRSYLDWFSVVIWKSISMHPNHYHLLQQRSSLILLIWVEDGELVEDVNGAKDVKEHDSTMDRGLTASNENDKNLLTLQQRGGFRTNGDQRASRTTDVEFQVTKPVPGVLPKNEDPSLVDRNKRMLGRMLGTLAKFLRGR